MNVYLLIVRDAEGNETEYDLIGEAILGRDQSADVRMPDGGVSRRHARIFLEDGLCYIEDLGSANGTFLDGEAVVGQVLLEPGRIAALGSFEIWVEDPEGVDHRSFPGQSISSEGDESLPPRREVMEVSSPSIIKGRLLGSLEGLSGGAFGRIFEVRDGSVVGRTSGVDIRIEDSSISRKHAEIRFVQGHVSVRDLDSANGTFVNELPIVERPIIDEDILTFGSVAFKFTTVADSAALEALARPSIPEGFSVRSTRNRSASGSGTASGSILGRRKLLVSALGLFGISVLAIVFFAPGFGLISDSSGSGEEQREIPPSPADDMRTEVFNLMRRAEVLMDSENWKQAEQIYGRVLDIDPINTQARAALEKAKLESRMKDVFEEANRISRLGGTSDLEDAIKIYMQVDPESGYRRRARFQVHQIIERLQGIYGPACRGAVRKRAFRDALPNCGRYMDLACHCPDSVDSRVEEALGRAERGLGVAARDRWRCPSGMEEWVPCASRVVIGDRDPERMIRQKYQAKELADALVSFQSGQVEDALRDLGRIENQSGADAEIRRRAVDLRRQIRIVQAKSRQGQTELMRGNLDNAHEEWKDIFEIEKEILPQGIQSSLRREAANRLSSAYHERGFEMQRMRRYPEAFEWYRRGYSVNPDDTRIGEGIRWLEGAAFHYLRRAQTCGELRQILRYTMDDPPSAAHQQVKQALSDRGC